MTMTLRLEMIALAILFFIMVIHNISTKKLWFKYSFLWLIFSLILIIVAVFPQIVFGLTYLLGLQQPSNLLYLIAIFALFVYAFHISIVMTKVSMQSKRLIQMVSINDYLNKNVNNKLDSNKE